MDEDDCGAPHGREGSGCGKRRGEGILFESDVSLCRSRFQFGDVKKGREGGIQKICGEATTLSFKKEVFDTIFHRSLLHHLAEKSVGRTMERVKTVLRHESTCLKREGNVMMIEPCLPVFLEWVERIFFFILRAVFFLTEQSEIFLFSAESLTRMLEESGYKEIKIWRGAKEKGVSGSGSPPSSAFPV